MSRSIGLGKLKMSLSVGIGKSNEKVIQWSEKKQGNIVYKVKIQIGKNENRYKVSFLRREAFARHDLTIFHAKIIT